MGRPAQGDRTKTEQVLVKLTRHQGQVLDALVVETGETKQDYIRGLIRDDYANRIAHGMKKVTGE